MKRQKFTTPSKVLVLLFSLTACSNEASTDTKSAANKKNAESHDTAWVDNSLTISFSSGINKGTHDYISSNRSGAGIKLSFAKNNGPNGVMFFEARDIKTKDGELLISSLKRFTNGDFKIGQNSASTWQGDAISKGDECGEVNLAKQQGSQTRTKFYGKSEDCKPTKILSMTAWRDVGSIHKERQVIGQFDDTVNFQQGTNTKKSDMVVKFVITQTELKY